MSPHISPLLFVFLALGFCSGTTVRARADDETSPAAASGPQQPSQTKPPGTLLETGGFSINNGYGLSALLDHNGSPNANVKVYGGGRLGPGATYLYKDAADAAASAAAAQPLAVSENRWGAGLGGTVVAGVLVALILWHGCIWLVGGTKSLADLHDGEDAGMNGSKDVKKSRKRRAIESDAHLTRLADMVLSAIESGQCMQRSVCLLGTQLGAGSSKSMLAATVLEKMLPASAQESVYFTTLQSALRGKAHCDKIRCGGFVDSSE